MHYSNSNKTWSRLFVYINEVSMLCKSLLMCFVYFKYWYCEEKLGDEFDIVFMKIFCVISKNIRLDYHRYLIQMLLLLFIHKCISIKIVVTKLIIIWTEIFQELRNLHPHTHIKNDIGFSITNNKMIIHCKLFL